MTLTSHLGCAADVKVGKERCSEVLADADTRLAQLDAELTQARHTHEQALLRQQEHASQIERQLEVRRRGYTFQRQFSKKPCTVPGCPKLELTSA